MTTFVYVLLIVLDIFVFLASVLLLYFRCGDLHYFCR